MQELLATLCSGLQQVDLHWPRYIAGGQVLQGRQEEFSGQMAPTAPRQKIEKEAEA